MAEQSLEQLYSGQILALAADIPHTGRLDAPQASVKKRSPLCGSTVTVDLVLDGGRIADFAQNVRACALGQASAAIFGAAVIGCDRAQIAALRADQWAENHPEIDPALRQQIRRQVRDTFYTDTPEWKAQIVVQGLEAARQAVAGLAGQPFSGR